MLDTKTMITKEDILEKHIELFKLALKGLEYEKIKGGQFIRIEDHAKITSGVRTYWESKYDSLVGQSANAIKKLQDELKSKDADLAEAPKSINDALTVQILQAQLTESMASHRASVDDANLSIFTLLKERDAFKDSLEKLKIENANTVTLQYHDEIVGSANRQIVSLRNERNAFHRLVGEMQTENGCMRDDLENMCNERDALKTENQNLKDSREKLIASVIGMK